MTGARSMDRADIVAAARLWTGTPYAHHQSARGIGADCLGLVRGVWRDLIGPEPEALPAYRPGWALLGRETLLAAAARHLAALDGRRFAAGDVVLFRWRDSAPVSHCAIASGPDRIVHAYQGHAVREDFLPESWRKRVSHRFGFPGVA